MKCGLLGRTLGHSYSPQIHSKLGDYSYTLFEKEPEQIEEFLKCGDFSGLNVTIPYKKCHNLREKDQGHTKSKIPFLGFVAKDQHTQHGTRAAAQKSGKEKMFFRNAAGVADLCALLVRTHQEKSQSIYRCQPQQQKNRCIRRDGPYGIGGDLGEIEIFHGSLPQYVMLSIIAGIRRRSKRNRRPGQPVRKLWAEQKKTLVKRNVQRYNTSIVDIYANFFKIR